jgi:hypothetical protein
MMTVMVLAPTPAGRGAVWDRFAEMRGIDFLRPGQIGDGARDFWDAPQGMDVK